MSVLSKKFEKHPGILVFDFVIKRSVEPVANSREGPAEPRTINKPEAAGANKMED